VAGDVGSEDADLAVGDLTSGAGVLPRHAAGRLTLLEKAVDPLRGSTIDHQHGVRIGQMLHDIPTDDVTQCIRAPAVAAQQPLLAPWTGISGCFGPHPAGLAPFVTKAARQGTARRSPPSDAGRTADGAAPSPPAARTQTARACLQSMHLPHHELRIMVPYRFEVSVRAQGQNHNCSTRACRQLSQMTLAAS